MRLHTAGRQPKALPYILRLPYSAEVSGDGRFLTSNLYRVGVLLHNPLDLPPTRLLSSLRLLIQLNGC